MDLTDLLLFVLCNPRIRVWRGSELASLCFYVQFGSCHGVPGSAVKAVKNTLTRSPDRVTAESPNGIACPFSRLPQCASHPLLNLITTFHVAYHIHSYESHSSYKLAQHKHSHSSSFPIFVPGRHSDFIYSDLIWFGFSFCTKRDLVFLILSLVRLAAICFLLRC